MSNTIWRHRRKNAEQAGREDAESGMNRAEKFEAMGVDTGEAYAKSKREMMREMVEAEAREFHPLHQISREATDLYNQTQSADIRELSELAERLADYLLENEK